MNEGITGDTDGDQLFYEDLVAGYVRAEGYVRREWLEEAVLDRLRRPECRYVLLVAEPGAGKTGVMAGLADRHPGWLRYFIRRDSTTPLSDGDAASALIRIGHQFAARQPALFDPQQLEVVVSQRVAQAGSESRVVGVRIEDLRVSPFRRTAIRVEQQVGELGGRLVGVEVTHATVEPRLLDPTALQYLALLDPAAVLRTSEPDAQVVILIDALDEVFPFRGGMSVLDWLERGPELPPNVRFVLSSRPHARLRTLEGVRAGSIELMTLDTGSAEVLGDTRTFARRMLARPEAAARLPDVDAAAELVAHASEGNFAYLRAYERALLGALHDGSEAAVASLLRLDVLPQGLGALYTVFFRNAREEIRQLGALDIEEPTGPGDEVTPAWEGAGQRMLGVLAVARAPLTLEQLMRLGAIRVWRSAADSVLQRLTPFLDETGRAWRLFHPSVAEFLVRDAAGEAPDLGVDGPEWHRRVVRAYRTAASWGEVDWEAVDDYGLLHLAEHLAELGGAGRSELTALVNPGLRMAARRRFLTDLPFKRIVDTALADAGEHADPGQALVSTIFLDVVRSMLSRSGRWLPPAVFGLMAMLGRFEEAQARVDLLAPGEHRFVAQQALVACTPAPQRALLGGHDGADRLVSAALDVPVNEDSLFSGLRRNHAIQAAATALAPHDLERALALAAEAGRDNAGRARDAVLAAAARSAAPGAAGELLGRMQEGQGAVAVDIARRASPQDRERLLLAAEQYVDAEPRADRITTLAGLVAGWHPADPRRAATAAGRLRSLIEDPPTADGSSWDQRHATVEAAITVRGADPELAAWLLERIGQDEEDAVASWEKIRAAGLWAAWGEPGRCRQLAERVLAYERGLGWYGPASDIAELAVAVDGADPEWGRQLADEAEQLIVAAATAATDAFERSRVNGKLGQVARAFRTWDRERALRVARHMGGRWISGGSWDSFDGRLSVLACLGIDARDTDIDLARQLLEECIPEQEPVTELGRPDARLTTGGLFRPAEHLVGGEAPMARVGNFVAYAGNSVNYWRGGRTWRAFTEPADVARSVEMAPGSLGALASWAGVIAAAVEPVAARDLKAAIDLAGWPSDPGERLIACAALARVLIRRGDGRAASAMDAVGRAAVGLPMYVAEVDVSKIPQGPVLHYLNPSVRARWEAALLLPPEAAPTAGALVTATGSWYLDASWRAQRLSDALFGWIPPETASQAVAGKVGEILTSIEGHPDDIQLDLVRAAAVWTLAARDAARAEEVASRIEHPGRAVLARMYQAVATASDPAQLIAACRAVLDAAPDGLPVLYQAVATAWAAGVIASSGAEDAGAEGAGELTDAAAAALASSDALTETSGLVRLAVTATGPRRAELLHAALRRVDDESNMYLRNDVLADMLRPAVLTGEAAVLTATARRLLAASWQVLMEGLRRAAGPLVALAGPALFTQLDEALRAAQRVVGAGAQRGHLDGVAPPSARVPVLAVPAPAAATASPPDAGSIYLTAGDLPGLTLVQDARGQDPDPGDYAFAACSGLHCGFQAWHGEPTVPILRLVDIRFVFPDAERAAAYHAERLLANSEGNPPVAGAPLAGEDCHVFGGTRRIAAIGDDMTMYVYVFRVGAVVVKLFAAQGTESAEPLRPEHLHALAQRVVTRVHGA